MMSGASRTLAHVLETAERMKLDVVFPEPNQLFLDLDTAADYARARRATVTCARRTRRGWGRRSTTAPRTRLW
jgi:hypothetical protein